jgi:hypothetical protein
MLAVTVIWILPVCVPALIAAKAALIVPYDPEAVPPVAVTDTCAQAALKAKDSIAKVVRINLVKLFIVITLVFVI